MSKKVAHLIRKNTQLRSSFIQNQILNHINYEPVVIYRYRSKRNDGGFAEYNDSYLELNLSKNKLIDFNFRYLKKLSKADVKKVLNFLDYQDVSILHFHYGTDAGIYTDVIRYSGRPSVISFYGYDAFSFEKKFLGYGKIFLNNKTFKYASKVFAMSPEMKKDLLQIGCPKDKILIHYHGVPSHMFKGIKNSYYQVGQNFTLLNISSFDPVKGHLFILNAIKKLILLNIKNVKLRLIGKGFFEQEIRKFVEKNHLIEYVDILGPIKYGSKEMLTELKNADVFIHPSVTTKNDKEGIPGSIVEAMLTGLPVISTFHGGIPYIINDGVTGFLVKEWDVDELSKKIKMLKNDITLREKIGRACQKFAIEQLDLHKKERELENIYDSLL